MIRYVCSGEWQVRKFSLNFIEKKEKGKKKKKRYVFFLFLNKPIKIKKNPPKIDLLSTKWKMGEQFMEVKYAQKQSQYNLSRSLWEKLKEHASVKKKFS